MSVNADSQGQPPEPQLSGSGMGLRNMHFNNLGDTRMCVPKARFEKAKHSIVCLLVLISFSYLFIKMCLLTLTHGGVAPPGPASL